MLEREEQSQMQRDFERERIERKRAYSRAYMAKYRKAHPDRIAAAQKRYYSRLCERLSGSEGGRE